MDVNEFVETVRKMRAQQNKYFKRRNFDDLMAARELERAVDKALIQGVTISEPTQAMTAEEYQAEMDLTERRDDQAE